MTSVLVADCLIAMAIMTAESVDAVVTDPPYGLKFMGKAWDHGVPGVPYWEAAWRLLKPGARLLAFGGTRTWHRLTTAIEDAGFEIEDSLCWLYGSGFPKHPSKLKPAFEPVVMARRPAERATALNIDACRLAMNETDRDAARVPQRATHGYGNLGNGHGRNGDHFEPSTLGRWPANVVCDEVAAGMVDEQSGDMRARGNITPTKRYVSSMFSNGGVDGAIDPGDTGGASRFYYTAKASRAERNEGLDEFAKRPLLWSAGTQNPGSFQSEGTEKAARNFHPTVKPVSLMRWLVRLVTPPNGLVLDPFCGSGTTGIAAFLEDRRFTGIEVSPEYAEIARARIAHASRQPSLFAEIAV